MKQKLQQPLLQFNPFKLSFSIRTVPPASEIKIEIFLSECVNLVCMILSINSTDVPKLHQQSLLYNGNTFCSPQCITSAYILVG